MHRNTPGPHENVDSDLIGLRGDQDCAFLKISQMAMLLRSMDHTWSDKALAHPIAIISLFVLLGY